MCTCRPTALRRRSRGARPARRSQWPPQARWLHSTRTHRVRGDELIYFSSRFGLRLCACHHSVDPIAVEYRRFLFIFHLSNRVPLKSLRVSVLAVIRAHSKEVYDMSWSAAQSGLLVSGSADGLVRLWNVPSLAQPADLTELKPLRSLSAAASSSPAASAAAPLSPVVTPALSRVYSVDTHPTDANCLAAASVEAAEHLVRAK
jgi:WD40 repeat protein